MKSSNKISIRILLTCTACLVLSQLMAQKKDSLVYPVVIQFQSVCCGVPADTPLRSFIRSFKKKNKIKKITAWHIGPMGREGEYWLAFSLKELNKKQAGIFIKEVKTVSEKMKDRGSALFTENMEIVKTELSPRASFTKVIL